MQRYMLDEHSSHPFSDEKDEMNEGEELLDKWGDLERRIL
jgi:hypothetical protein